MKKYSKEFTISTAPQRSPGWYQERAGIPSSSGLSHLFDTLRDGRTPSAKAKEYLKQLAYERLFGVTYERFDSQAMKEGRFFEDFAKLVYIMATGNRLEEAFSYVSDWFVSTPDAYVTDAKTGVRGLLECKIMGDKSFMTAIEEGLSDDHKLQTQSQMMASGLDWVDYIVVNLKSRAYFILRVHRDEAFINDIYKRLHEPLVLPELKTVAIERFDESLLQGYLGASSPEVTTELIENLPF